MNVNEFLAALIFDRLREVEARRNLRRQHALLRDTSDPFSLPEMNFRQLFRLNKDAVRYLVEALQEFVSEPSRADGIPSYIKVFTALRFFAHGSYQKAVARDFQSGLSQPSVSRCIREVAEGIMNLSNRWIKFPSTDDEILTTKRRFFEKFHFPGVLGCIDGTHVAIVSPNENDENFPAVPYYNRKGFHSINVQIIVNSNLTITSINARYPGSVHDAAIWTMSEPNRMLENRFNTGIQGEWLLGDSGYPLHPFLITPIEGAQENTPESRYTKRHIRTRICVERAIGLLKSRFRCLLRHRTLHYQPDKAGQIIYACAVLHNMCLYYNVQNPEDEIEEEDNNENVNENINRNINGNRNLHREGQLVRNDIILRYFN